MSLNAYIFYYVLFMPFSRKTGSYSESHLSPRQTQTAGLQKGTVWDKSYSIKSKWENAHLLFSLVSEFLRTECLYSLSSHTLKKSVTPELAHYCIKNHYVHILLLTASFIYWLDCMITSHDVYYIHYLLFLQFGSHKF